MSAMEGLREELRMTGDEMLHVIKDADEWKSPIPLSGAMTGMVSGIVFMVAVEDYGKGGSPWEVSALQSKVEGLKQARAQLSGHSPAVESGREKINQAIVHKRTEIQAATPPKTSFGKAMAETASPLAGGTALGIFVFTAIAARMRVFKQRRRLA